MDIEQIKKILHEESIKRNKKGEITFEKPDPLLVAGKYNDEAISLICALFAYGKASLIVKFLNSLDFDLLKESDEKIISNLNSFYYRLQKDIDIANLFISIKRLKEIDTIENIFYESYKKENNVVDGINKLISILKSVNNFSSNGYNFLTGKESGKLKSSPPFKRWNLYLRWMVRSDFIDLGLWTKVDKKDLLIPMDTHVFQIARKLKFITKNNCTLESAIELTNKLKEFDANDPVKYDMAIYRIGQEQLNLFDEDES